MPKSTRKDRSRSLESNYGSSKLHRRICPRISRRQWTAAREREERPGISAANVNTPRPRKPLVFTIGIPPTRKVEQKGGEKNEKIRETKGRR